MGTAIVVIILIIIVYLIIKSMLSGKVSCSHDCNSCGSHGSCHKLDDLKRDLKKAKDEIHIKG